MDRPYYLAYDVRYRAVHAAGFTTCVPGAFPRLMFAVVTPNGGGT